MAWRFVCQPNGNLARFSEVVDNFTHVDLSREEAHIIAREFMGQSDARAKVRAAYNDLDRYGDKGDGLSRWREAIRVIRRVHGDDGASRAMEEAL